MLAELYKKVYNLWLMTTFLEQRHFDPLFQERFGCCLLFEIHIRRLLNIYKLANSYWSMSLRMCCYFQISNFAPHLPQYQYYMIHLLNLEDMMFHRLNCNFHLLYSDNMRRLYQHYSCHYYFSDNWFQWRYHLMKRLHLFRDQFLQTNYYQMQHLLMNLPKLLLTKPT